jgi:hypothetical protein
MCQPRAHANVMRSTRRFLLILYAALRQSIAIRRHSMSAASSAATVRRNAATAPAPRPAPSAQAAAPRPAPRVQQPPVAFLDDVEDEFKLHLADIPEVPEARSMDVEGFKPSLLSKFLDLVSPHK